MDFQLQVKAIADSDNIKKQLLDLENYYKSNPIKIQMDLGRSSSLGSGASNVSAGLNKATDAAKGYTAAIDGMRLAKDKMTSSGSLVQTFKSESDAIDKTVTITKNGTTEISNYDSALKRTASNASAIDTLKIRIKGLTQEQLNLTNASERLAKAENLTDPIEKGRELRSLTNDINAATKGTNTFAASIQYMTERFLQIGLIVMVIRELKTAITDMVKNVIDLDTSLVEVQKVTDLAGESLELFTNKAFKVGESVARTGKEVIDATAIFARSGYEIEDALDLSETAMIMMNVGDGIDTVENAATSLIAVLKGYKLEAKDAADVTSLINEVSNNAAINFEDLTEGLTRTSAVFGQSGVSIQKLTGLLTGTNEILQNIEKSSTGLITLNQRIRGITTLGEDGYEGVSKLSKELKRLAGINIYDSTGQLRDTYDILKDMSKIFPTLNKNTQQYLGELVAGKRQISVLQSVLLNWKGVEKAVNAATNSTGSAEKEQAKYVESIAGKIEQLNSAWLNLSKVSINSNFVKNIVDALKDLTNFISKIGGLSTALSTLSLIFSNKLAQGLIVFAKQLASPISSMIKMTSLSGKMGEALARMGISATSVTTALSGVFAVISAGLIVYSLLSAKAEEAKQAQEQLKEEQLEADKANISLIESVSETNKQLGIMSQKYEELSKKESLTKEEEEDLKTLNETMIGLIGDRSSALNGLTSGTKEYTSKLLELTKQTYAANIAQLQLAKTSAENIASQKSEELTGGGDSSRIVLAYVSSEKYKKYLESEMQYLRSSGQEESEEYKKIEQEYSDHIKQMSEYSEEATNVLKSSIALELAKAFESGNIPKTDKDLEQLARTISLSMNKTGYYNGVVLSLVKSMVSLDSGTIQLEESTDDTISTVSSAITKLEELKSVYSTISLAISELESSNKLSIGTLESLMDLDDKYLSYLFDENGQLVLNKKSLENLTQARINELKASIIQDASDRIQTLNSETQEINKKTKATNSLTEAEIAQMVIMSEDEDAAREIFSNMEMRLNAVDLLVEKYNLMGSEFSTTSSELQKANEAFNSQNSLLDDAQSAYTTLTNAIDEYNSNGAVSIDTLQSLFSLSPEYLQMFFNQATAADNATNAIYNQAQMLQIAKIQELQASAANDVYLYSLGQYGNMSTFAQQAIGLIGSSAITTGANLLTATAQSATFREGVLSDVNALRSAAGLSTISTSGLTSGMNSIINAYKNLASSIGSIDVSNISDLSSSTGGAGKAADSAADSYSDLVEIVMKMLKQEVNEQIDALNDELDVIEKIHDKATESLEDQLDAYKELIDIRKKSLEQQKDEKDYQDELSEKQKSVSEIQQKLDEISLDNSESGIAKKKELEEELVDSQKELTDLQYEHSIEVQEDALDDSEDTYEKQVKLQEDALDEAFEDTKEDYERRIQELNDYLDKEGLIRQEAIDLISGKTAEFYDRLYTWNRNYGDMTDVELKTLISSASTAESSITQSMGGASKAVGGVGNAAGSAKDKFDSLNFSAGGFFKIIANIASFLASNSWIFNILGSVFSGSVGGIVSSGISGLISILSSNMVETHHDGIDSGFVGGALNGNEEFIKALKGELLVRPDQMQDYTSKYLPNMVSQSYNSGVNASYKSGMNFENLVSINVTGNIDSSSVDTVTDAVSSAFAQLNKTFKSRGIVRTANNFI